MPGHVPPMSGTLLTRAVGAARTARTTAVRVRRRVERMNTVPALGGHGLRRPLLVPVHLSVLGGRTLNAAVPFPRPASGIAAARLELRRGGHQETVPLEQEPAPAQGDGGVLLAATTALLSPYGAGSRTPGPGRPDPLTAAPRTTGAPTPAPRAPGLVLSAGVWRIAVVVTDGTGRELRASLAAPAPLPADGPTLPGSPSPECGTLFRPVRSVDGHAMLKVTPPRRQAELTALDLRWDGVTVRGRLVGGGEPHLVRAAYTAEAVRRGAGATGRALPADLRWDGDGFAFDLPLAAMAGGERVQRTWDVQLRSGRARLRVARRLTDVRHPRRVFRTPYRVIALEDGALLRVHAHVTAAGALAVTCAAIDPQTSIDLQRATAPQSPNDPQSPNAPRTSAGDAHTAPAPTDAPT
ncbi:hypothetical protein [Streptomyces sp. NPDC047108]|uniref:hypothetical protein n=1 Tax=Streptomyces sp. NPDC047108 TaxID=3155025 RepID=UPI0033F989F6